MYDVQRGGLFHSPSNTTLRDSGSLFYSTISHKLTPPTPEDFANSQIEQPCGMVPQPSTAYTVSGLSAVVDPEQSACRRLISCAFIPREIIPLIEAIFTSDAETDVIGDLRGEDAQTFIDLVHGVRLQFHLEGDICRFFCPPAPTPSLFTIHLPPIVDLRPP